MTTIEIASEQILRLPQVTLLTGLSRSAIYVLMNESKFPQAIMLTERCVGWVASEVREWIAERINASRIGSNDNRTHAKPNGGI